jgi:hypothetical protein
MGRAPLRRCVARRASHQSERFTQQRSHFIHAANGACVFCSGYAFGCWRRRAVARGLMVRHFGYCFVTSQSRVVQCIGETLHYHEFSFHGLFLVGMATQVHAATGFCAMHDVAAAASPPRPSNVQR